MLKEFLKLITHYFVASANNTSPMPPLMVFSVDGEPYVSMYQARDTIFKDMSHSALKTFMSRHKVRSIMAKGDCRQRLEGVFGPSYKVTRTIELMEQGYISQLDIQCLVLKHLPQRFDTYEDEIQYLITHEQRNKFITNLSLDLKGNTLVLYSRVETHGAILHELINTSRQDDRKVFFIHGGVDAEERELVREITERENNAIIVASYGTFSTGINIKSLHNVIFASPSKSRVRNLQSIGRVLRKGKNKTKAVLYDISDDCTIQSRKNYTLNHFIERIKIYNEEQFNYEIITIQLKSK